MKKKSVLAAILGISLICLLLLDSRPGRSQENLTIEQTVFARMESGELRQLIKIGSGAIFPDQVMVRAKTETGTIEEIKPFPQAPGEISFLVPACQKGSCPMEIQVLDAGKKIIGQGKIDLKPVRPWKIFLAPFTHTDIGFTQSQQKVLTQNLSNLKLELQLIEQTRNYPEMSRFKLFTEVSWAVDEFLNSKEIPDPEKENLRRAIREKNIELGAFYISHQNKFMPDEASFASVLPGLKIADALKVPLSVACIHDVFDFSGVVKPLSNAGVKYLMVGPNDARYAVPPLFYLTAPKGPEKILVWHTAHLNGYGENYDFKMRLMPPFAEAAFAEMENLASRHLKSLEDGFPNRTIAEHYDFFGASWPYPYDAYLLPFYPALGGDNQPQNIAPSALAKKWNEQWTWPEMIVSTPGEFFEYAEKNWSGQIPVIRGEMPGFWGEQIFVSMMQVDPQKEMKQREFERMATSAGIALADKFLAGGKIFNPIPRLWEGYRPLILNNDHNPMPVPFGGLNYTAQDMKDWKRTRRDWIGLMTETGNSVLAEAVSGAGASPAAIPSTAEAARAFSQGPDFILENMFYKIQVDAKTGGIKSLIDKELKKELVRPGAKYQLNQYLLAVRGEEAGLRDYLKVKPGFKSVKARLGAAGPKRASIRIEGRIDCSIDGAEPLSKFVAAAFNLKIPAGFLRSLVWAIFMRGKKPLTLNQEIILPSDEKRIEFVQHFSGNMPQWVDHLFGYPLNFSPSVPVEYDAGYNLLSFSPAAPLGLGDLIPAAKNTSPFPSINASLVPFQWMQGLPPDLMFRNYLMLRGDDYAAAFASRESGAAVPGPLEKGPEKGVLGGEFYHLAIGWTVWGKIGLGADLDRDNWFHSALTSFPAGSDAEARAKAMQFSWSFNQKRISRLIKISPASVMLVNAWPENDSTLALRLWETSGEKTDLKIELNPGKKLSAVYLARSDGKPISKMGFQGNRFSAAMEPGQVLTLRLEFAGE